MPLELPTPPQQPSIGASELAIELALFAVPLAIAAVLAHGIYRLVRPTFLLLRGRYVEAATAATQLERSWLALLPTVRNPARYMVACALHLEGRLDASLAALRRLDDAKLDSNLRYAVRSLEAASLVLAGRDFERAGACLREALMTREMPEDLLLLAHVEHERGQVTAAVTMLARADALGPTARGSRALLVNDAALKRTMFHALRALYLIRMGRAAEAIGDLELAAAGPNGNVYADRARAAMTPRASAEDPRSSLAPQMIGEASREPPDTI